MAVGADGIGYAPQAPGRLMTMKRMLPATVGLATLAVVLVGCATNESAMRIGADAYRNAEYVSAADAFSDAIAANPRSAPAWNNRAAARVRLGDVNGAIADYTRAIELVPNDADVYYNRGNAYVAAGLYQEAVSDYTRAIQLAPNSAKAFFNRGTAYAALGQRDAAQADWNRAVALEPDPSAKAAMRRSAGLDATPVVMVAPPEIVQPTVAPAPVPGTGPATAPPPRAPLAAQPPVPPLPPPAVAVAPRSA